MTVRAGGTGGRGRSMMAMAEGEAEDQPRKCSLDNLVEVDGRKAVAWKLLLVEGRKCVVKGRREELILYP